MALQKFVEFVSIQFLEVKIIEITFYGTVIKWMNEIEENRKEIRTAKKWCVEIFVIPELKLNKKYFFEQGVMWNKAFISFSLPPFVNTHIRGTGKPWVKYEYTTKCFSSLQSFSKGRVIVKP